MNIPFAGGFQAGRINPYSTPGGSKPQLPAQTPVQPASNEPRPDFVKSSDKGIRLAERLQSGSDYRQTIYDQPNFKASRAISTYTEFAYMERRAEVQSLIGVDVYA